MSGTVFEKSTSHCTYRLTGTSVFCFKTSKKKGLVPKCFKTIKKETKSCSYNNVHWRAVTQRGLIKD